MKLLLVHNYYQQLGGEDLSFGAEADLLAERGHEVIRFTRHNDALVGRSQVKVALDALWNREIYGELRQALRRHRPAVMFVTNTFPMLSPAALYAASRERTPVVFSIHNYRMLCCNAFLFRNGAPCEDCIGKRFAYPGIRHACYRDSRLASAVVASVSAVHRTLAAWKPAVDMYWTPSEFARQKHVEAGFPAERVVAKPNFLSPAPPFEARGGDYAVFVGRLSPEKGLPTLFEAWRLLNGALPLKIVGDGPLADYIRKKTEGTNVEYLGRQPHVDVLKLIGGAKLLVMPSTCNETFGRTIIEAYASGTPVVVSRLGAMAELVREGETGLLFEPGNAVELAAAVQRLIADPERLSTMRIAARREFEARYTADENLRLMLELFDRAINMHAERHGRRRPQAPALPAFPAATLAAPVDSIS